MPSLLQPQGWLRCDVPKVQRNAPHRCCLYAQVWPDTHRSPPALTSTGRVYRDGAAGASPDRREDWRDEELGLGRYLEEVGASSHASRPCSWEASQQEPRWEGTRPSSLCKFFTGPAAECPGTAAESAGPGRRSLRTIVAPAGGQCCACWTRCWRTRSDSDCACCTRCWKTRSDSDRARS